MDMRRNFHAEKLERMDELLAAGGGITDSSRPVRKSRSPFGPGMKRREAPLKEKRVERVAKGSCQKLAGDILFKYQMKPEVSIPIWAEKIIAAL